MNATQRRSIRVLRRSGLYTTASEISRVALELAVAHISGWHQCAAIEGARGQVGFEPNFARLEHAGRRGFTLTASVYGHPEVFEAAGYGEILAPGRPGYSRIRIHEVVRLPEFLQALDLGWRERERRSMRARPQRAARGGAA